MSSKFIGVFGFLAVLLLSACNTVSLGTERSEYSVQRPCCKSNVDLPVAPLNKEGIYSFAFNSASPHFDSGQGLAPFLLIPVDSARSKRVEVASMNRGASTLAGTGNDNTFRVAYIYIQFFDMARKVIPSQVVGPNNIVLGVSGQYSASWLASIPEGASYMLVTADPKKIDERFQGCVRPRAAGNEPLLDQCVRYPAGVLEFEWRGWVYGNVLVALR